MARFGKFFGRKPNRSEGENSSASEHPPAATESAARQSAVQVYGIKFLIGSSETRTFDALPVTIGRADDNLLKLADDSVSAHHAVVLYDERLKEICIQDLDSLNGVFIGGSPTRKNILHDGAQIGIGGLQLIYRDTGYIYPG